MALLAGVCYDPATAVAKSTATLIAMTAMDTTNLRLTFTAPSSGIVLVRLAGMAEGATTAPQVLFGVLQGTTVVKRMSPMGAYRGTALATTHIPMEAVFLVTGLTGGASLTWDAAYGVETAVTSTGIKYGGPDNSAADNAFGGLCFEIWRVD